jgi:hypothetical protein
MRRVAVFSRQRWLLGRASSRRRPGSPIRRRGDLGATGAFPGRRLAVVRSAGRYLSHASGGGDARRCSPARPSNAFRCRRQTGAGSRSCPTGRASPTSGSRAAMAAMLAR